METCFKAWGRICAGVIKTPAMRPPQTSHMQRSEGGGETGGLKAWVMLRPPEIGRGMERFCWHLLLPGIWTSASRALRSYISAAVSCNMGGAVPQQHQNTGPQLAWSPTFLRKAHTVKCRAPGGPVWHVAKPTHPAQGQSRPQPAK